MTKKELLKLLNQMTLDEKIGQMVQILGKAFLEDNLDTSTGPIKA